MEIIYIPFLCAVAAVDGTQMREKHSMTTYLFISFNTTQKKKKDKTFIKQILYKVL